VTRPRVIVALDASPPSAAVARTAVALARALGADVTGIFVEDENLLRLAALPFAREQPVSGGPARSLALAGLEGDLRALAARARESLSRAASGLAVSWSFEVRRGSVADEVISAAGSADLLVVGARGQGARGSGGATARAALERSPGPVLVHRGEMREGGGVLVAYDGTAEGDAALAAAAWLAPGARVEACCLSPEPRRGEELAARARRIVPGLSVAASWAGGGGIDRLLIAAARARPALLVLPSGSPLLERGGRARLLAEAPCPVLVARQRPGR